MSDTTTTDAAEVAEDVTEVVDESTVDNSDAVQGEDSLGDAGKKALDAMKAKWKAADALAKTRDAELAQMRAVAEGKEAEFKAEQERRAVEAAALGKANDRILRSEFKAAAKGVLNDPEDVYRYVDLADFEVDDDGNVDEGAIAKAIDALVKSKPYLAVAQGTRFQGTADQGARKAAEESEEQKLTEALKTAPPEQRIAIRQRLAQIRAEAA